MGNRAVITASLSNDPQTSNDIGIYLHWNGGRDSVEIRIIMAGLVSAR